MTAPATINSAGISHLDENRALLLQSHYAARVVFDILDRLLTINSVLDLGCGRGIWLQIALLKPGRTATGIDLEELNSDELLFPAAAFVRATIDQPMDLQRRFDLLLCLETAEQITPEGAHNLISNCVRHSDIVLFAAAIPGQDGLRHLNEQPPEYWQHLFDQAGYEVVDIIRPFIWRDHGIPPSYRQNMLLFVNRKRAALVDLLCSEAGRVSAPLHKAHPDLFFWKDQELSRIQRALQQECSRSLQAENRLLELQTDLSAQCDWNSRVLSEIWNLMNQLRGQLQREEFDRQALEKSAAFLQEALTTSERDRRELRASFSWRLTSPLRTIARLLPGFK